MRRTQSGTTPQHLNGAGFAKEVFASPQPVLVLFGTPWSKPCQVLFPILEELAHEWAGAVKVVSVNADDSLDLSLCYNIQSIPTLLFFVEGELRLQIVGTATKEAILAKLRLCGLPGRGDTSVKQAPGSGPAISNGGMI